LKYNLFSFFAILSVPLAALVELETWLLGHELTYFGRTSPLQSAWIRYALIAAAISSVVLAVLNRRPRAGET
jgi:hypothetical protein